ncbi:hypothetical protein CBR_g53748 [Chara braunii]|uniref:Rieske domain-containing protein n=1 Tax=Chara braunii TaxID=69332 RepID=A0A388MBB0_CHABU|nr:hypothetical protein CBR_g53748 [Chara braunii]|eukprot:GBG91857.1 hypothetical protein CBR_g53748 [Chara braunii]
MAFGHSSTGPSSDRDKSSSFPTAAATTSLIGREGLPLSNPVEPPGRLMKERPGDADDEEEEEQSTDKEGDFQWHRHWYAVAPVSHLDKKEPHAVTVLGRRYVLWWDRSGVTMRPGNGKESVTDQKEDGYGGHAATARDGGGEGGGASTAADRNKDHIFTAHGGDDGDEAVGTWRAFLDMCPHRLAPLSEGRINEQGRLQCSYHGWSFGGDGGCKRIPQEGLEQRSTASPRACAIAVPTTVFKGVILLWPDESEEGSRLATQTPPPIVPDRYRSGLIRYKEYYLRELYYSYETLVENLLDPSHLPFAHHKTSPAIGRDSAHPMDFKALFERKEGFKGQVYDEVLSPGVITVQFIAPSIVTYTRELTVLGHPYTQVDLFYVTPTEPGRSIFMYRYTGTGVGRGSMVSLLAGTLSKVGTNHMFLSNFLDSDSYFLHVQERYLERMRVMEARNFKQAYFMPTSADRLVVAFWRWLEKHGSGGVKWAITPSATRLPRGSIADVVQHKADGMRSANRATYQNTLAFSNKIPTTIV